MGVQVDGDIQSVLQAGDQNLCGVRLEQAGHILDGDGVAAHLLQFLGHVNIVLQGVVTRSIGDLASVADGAFYELVLLQSFVNGDFHAGQPVQGVEDTEHVNAALGGQTDEFTDDVIGIAGVAHGVGAAQQHLEGDIGDLTTEPIQTFPGRFVQETVCHIEGSAAPHLQGEAVCQDLSHSRCALDHITSTHTGGQQALMGVTAGGVSDQQLLLIQHPLAQGFGAVLIQVLLQAGLGIPFGYVREAGRLIQLLTCGGVIDNDVADVFQHLVGTVLRLADGEQLRRVINELGIALASLEDRIGQDVADEGDVGLDAADSGLTQGTQCLAASALKGVVQGGDLNQQAVVVGRDLCAHIGVACVQTDAETAAGTISGDLTGVRCKVVGRILGGDTALDGVAAGGHVSLAGDANGGIAQGTAFRNEDLGTNQVDAGDHFGDGMFHLDTGVHLDEVMVALAVHQEFQGTGVDEANGLGDLDGVFIQGVADGLIHRESGGVFHDLLVTALQRAVTLEQVNDIAVLVSQNLDLNVLGTFQELFNEDVAVAERLQGFAVNHVIGCHDFFRLVAATHTTAAAAGCRLEDDGEAKLDGLCQRFFAVLQGFGAAGDDGNAAADSDLFGLELVTHLLQNVGGGADEDDTVCFAGTGKVRIFRQEAVAGMDGIDTALFGQVDDQVNVQIGANGAQLLANLVRLIRLGTEGAVHVFLGVHRDGVQTQVSTGSEDTNRDLASVGDQYFLDFLLTHLNHLLLLPTRRTPQTAC